MLSFVCLQITVQSLGRLQVANKFSYRTTLRNEWLSLCCRKSCSNIDKIFREMNRRNNTLFWTVHCKTRKRVQSSIAALAFIEVMFYFQVKDNSTVTHLSIFSRINSHFTKDSYWDWGIVFYFPCKMQFSICRCLITLQRHDPGQ